MLFLYIAQYIPNLMPLGHTISASAMANPVCTGGGTGVLGQIITFVNQIRAVVEYVGFAIFFIGITIAAIMRMVAFGSERRIMISNMAITSAIVGMAIIAMSIGIQQLLVHSFGYGC
jgi:hypothetical protein